MSGGPIDDLLPSPDEILLMEEDLSVISRRAARMEASSVLIGPVTVWWGFTMALASLGFILRNQYLLPERLPISPIQATLGYGGTFLYWLVRGRHAKFKSWQSQALTIVWIFSAVNLFLFNIGCELIHSVDMRVMEAFLCFNFAVVIAALGTFNRWRWLLMAAIGWTVSGAAMFFLNDVIGRQTVLGSACLLFMMVPGLIASFGGPKA